MFYYIFILKFSKNFGLLKASENANKEVKSEFLTEELNPASLIEEFYILGPGDIVRIKFIGIKELSGTFPIMIDELIANTRN